MNNIRFSFFAFYEHWTFAGSEQTAVMYEKKNIADPPQLNCQKIKYCAKKKKKKKKKKISIQCIFLFFFFWEIWKVHHTYSRQKWLLKDKIHTEKKKRT